MNIPFERSIASHEKSIFWSNENVDKNDTFIEPTNVFKSTRKEYKFNCDCGHIFQAPLYTIISGSWCPYCSNPPKKLCDIDICQLCYNNSFASHPYSVNFSDKNIDETGNKLNPRKIFKRTGKKYLFICPNCKHLFEKRLDNDSECPYCSNPPKQLCIDDNCQLCFEKSFASHTKSIQWNIEKNGELTPRNTLKNGDKRIWFNCDNCNHIFDAQIKTITKGQWCPYCSNPPKKLCDNDNCQLCFEKSFASHEKVIFWNKEKNGNLIPRQIMKNSHTLCWFNCDKCYHCFSVVLYGIKRGWCNYCSNKVLCNDINCQLCLQKSFALHSRAINWDKEKNGDITPRDVFMNSGITFHFICDKNSSHTFSNKLNCISDGIWCPYCVNKTEAKLYDTIITIYPNIITQFKKEWCSKLHNRKYYLPYDFCIPEYKIIIELDGAQHFKQVMDWKSPEEQFENDKYKEECANDNGYSVIRLLQEDVFYDTYDWVKELCDAIEEVKSNEGITNVYLCKNDEYDQF